MTKKVCVITGSRAEYGLLSPLMHAIKAAQGLDLQVIATGMHLAPEFGNTWREIARDGFRIDARARALCLGPDGADIAKSISTGVASISRALIRLKPDIAIILGDRFEIFSAATAALCQRIPIAHINGGELTEGAIDDAFRHAITKMSSLHFTSTEEYRQRVIQLGEPPKAVYTVGALSIDNIRGMRLMDRPAVEKALHLVSEEKYLLVTFHPVTTKHDLGVSDFSALLSALDQRNDVRIIFTRPNADAGGLAISRMIDGFIDSHRAHSEVHTNMGQPLYLSAMKHSSAVVGNSSSGIVEAPSFGIPSVNIGDRQKGRIRATSIIDCAPVAEAISKALTKSLSSPSFKKKAASAIETYGDGKTAPRILAAIRENLKRGIPLDKKFHDITKPRRRNEP